MDSSWTDDIPVCGHTGVGTATNEIYRKDGRRREMHPNEDRLFHFSVGEFGLCLYGVLDGFSGSDVAEFAAKKMPAELLLGQVTDHTSCDGIKDILKQAFVSVDREYFQSISENLASRAVMRFDGLVQAQDPSLLRLDEATLTGATATIGLLFDDLQLYVANVGDTEAVIATQLPDGQIKAECVTVDHVLDNEDECLRLSHLGMNLERLKGGALGPFGYTRCLGCHRVKGGYKEVNELWQAADEPVLPLPEIRGPIAIGESHLFFLIFSKSLMHCLSQVLDASLDKAQLLTELCCIVREQFAENTTVSGVAQSVVDKVVRMHRESCETEPTLSPNGMESTVREDISLLVRNFHCRLASKSRSSSRVLISGSSNGADLSANAINSAVLTGAQRGAEAAPPPRTAHSSTTTDSSDAFVKQPDPDMFVDENGRIKSYVDFSSFHLLWNQYHQSQQRNPI